jgi:hypothetical protein
MKIEREHIRTVQSVVESGLAELVDALEEAEGDLEEVVNETGDETGWLDEARDELSSVKNSLDYGDVSSALSPLREWLKEANAGDEAKNESADQQKEAGL